MHQNAKKLAIVKSIILRRSNLCSQMINCHILFFWVHLNPWSWLNDILLITAWQKTRKILTEKIEQLNSAIDDVSSQLRSEDAPNGAAVNSDEVKGIEATIWDIKIGFLYLNAACQKYMMLKLILSFVEDICLIYLNQVVRLSSGWYKIQYNAKRFYAVNQVDLCVFLARFYKCMFRIMKQMTTTNTRCYGVNTM